MNLDALHHDPEWLEDDSRRTIANRSRILIDPRDQARLGVGESQWVCRHCGDFLEDDWARCDCRG